MKSNLKAKSEEILKNIGTNTHNTIKTLNLNSHTVKKGLYYINDIGFTTFNEMFLYVCAYNREVLNND